MNMILNKIFLIILSVFLILISKIYFEKKIVFNKKKSLIIIIALILVLTVSILILNGNYGINSLSVNYLFLIYLLFMITIHDIKEKNIPVEWLIFGFIIGLIFLLFNPNVRLLDSLISPIIYFVLLFLLSKLFKGGIGFGDILIFALLSFLTGWKMTFTILILSLLSTGMLGIVLYIFKKVDKKTTLPFMPFIFLITLIVLWI